MGSDVVTDKEATKIINRLRTIEGHVKGVTRMVEDDAYCLDIVCQIKAIQAALQKVSASILNRQLHACLIIAVLGNDLDEREQMIDMIMGVFEIKGKLH